MKPRNPLFDHTTPQLVFFKLFKLDSFLSLRRAVTILPPSKHLAHKVWVGFPEAVEVLPSGVVRALAIPADQ
jgi:hypothetical protein